MSTTGIRELRQRASELLRRVEAGETIQITDRGRPVAILAPLPQEGPTASLRATGDLAEAPADLGSLPPPLRLRPDQEPPGSVLERLRANER
jgi:prevent-host-death family protein